MMELLVIHVLIDSAHTVKGHKGEGQMILFHGTADGPLFEGEILPGGVDTQKQYNGETRQLSARYVLKGRDLKGNDCQIFIENNAVFEPGKPMVTHPVIFTDSPELKWLEDAEIFGLLKGNHEGCTITFYEKEEC